MEDHGATKNEKAKKSSLDTMKKDKNSKFLNLNVDNRNDDVKKIKSKEDIKKRSSPNIELKPKPSTSNLIKSKSSIDKEKLLKDRQKTKLSNESSLNKDLSQRKSTRETVDIKDRSKIKNINDGSYSHLSKIQNDASNIEKQLRKVDKNTKTTKAKVEKSLTQKHSKSLENKSLSSKITSKVTSQNKSKPVKIAPTVTNVTVNSPIKKNNTNILNELITEKFETPVSTNRSLKNNDDERQESIKHRRFKTRTLDPAEVKVVHRTDDSNTENSVDFLGETLSSISHHTPLIGKPKSFYIPLKDNSTSNLSELGLENVHTNFGMKNDETYSPSSAENSSEKIYEDDFESYESDFDSYSSSKKSKLNDVSSNSSSRNSDSELDHSTHEDISKDQFGDRVSSPKDEDKNYDSGHFDFKEAKNIKSNDVKMKEISEDENLNGYDSLKINDTGKLASYTDEGFDENSCGFSSVSITNASNQNVIKDNFCDVETGSNRKEPTCPQKLKLLANKERIKDLLSLIILDNVNYSLFEMSPIPYDIFMKTFGKLNSTQGSCQTNEDNIDEINQTEFISTDSKWTQYPVEYSNHSICSTISSADKNDLYKSNQCDWNLKTNLHYNNILVKDNKNNNNEDKTQSPLQIFCNQKLGCTASIYYSIDDIEKKMVVEHKNSYIKVLKFINKVGKVILGHITETSTHIHKKELFKSDLKLSAGYILPKFKISYLKDRPASMIHFDDKNTDVFLTVHPEKPLDNSLFNDMTTEYLMFARPLICIWSFQNDHCNEPEKVLMSTGNISSCIFHKGLSGIVVAGLENGTVAAWDLKEQSWWHHLLPVEKYKLFISQNSTVKEAKTNIPNYVKSEMEIIDDVLFRCCTFNSFDPVKRCENSNIKWWGSVVDILFSSSSTTIFDQVYTLQEYGLLTIWTIVPRKSFAMDADNDSHNNSSTLSNNQAYWAKWTFHKSLVINIQESLMFDINSSFPTAISKSNNEFISDFNLVDARRRNSLRKILNYSSNISNHELESSPLNSGYSKNKSPELHENERGFDFTSLLGKLSQNDTFSKSATQESSRSTNMEWEQGIICSVIKSLQDLNACSHLLITCTKGRVVHFSRKGLKKRPFIFSCGDESAVVKSLETCPYGQPHFLVGCNENTIHLYSITNETPLKNFNYSMEVNETISSSSLQLAGVSKSIIINILWSKLSPCLFFAYSKSGNILVWNLLESDIVPKLVENFYTQSGSEQKEKILSNMQLISSFSEENASTNEFLVLTHTNGEIQIHTLNKDLLLSNKRYEHEKKILQKYLQIL